MLIRWQRRRGRASKYQNLKRSVDELVGRINGQYSPPNHTPVVYINQSVSRDKLAVRIGRRTWPS